MARDFQFQKILYQGYQKSITISSSLNALEIRWLYLYSSLIFILIFINGRVLNPKLDSDLVIDQSLSIALSFALTLSSDLDLDLIDGYTLDLQTAIKYAIEHSGEEEMIKELRFLAELIPDSHNKNSCREWWSIHGESWVKKTKALILKFRNFQYEWDLSDVQKKTIERYYDANKLFLRCLNSGCIVSDRLRQEIEETLLLPIAEIEKRRREAAE